MYMYTVMFMVKVCSKTTNVHVHVFNQPVAAGCNVSYSPHATYMYTVHLQCTVPPALRSELFPLYWEKWKKMDSFRSQQMMNPNVGCMHREADIHIYIVHKMRTTVQ